MLYKAVWCMWYDRCVGTRARRTMNIFVPTCSSWRQQPGVPGCAMIRATPQTISLSITRDKLKQHDQSLVPIIVMKAAYQTTAALEPSCAARASPPGDISYNQSISVTLPGPAQQYRTSQRHVTSRVTRSVTTMNTFHVT